MLLLRIYPFARNIIFMFFILGQAVARPGGPEGHVAHAFGSLLLLTDNYIIQLRTKPQRHEGTKDAQKVSRRSSSFAILAGYRQQCQATAGPRSAPLVSRLPLVARRPWARPGRRCCQGGLDCLTGARARKSGSTIAHLFLMGRDQAMRVYAHIIRNKRIEIS